MTVTRISRKRFLALTGGLAGAAYLSACDLSTEPNEGGGSGDEDGDKPAEAPMLAELVERGELPALEERLPEEPLVIEPVDRIGVYGGTWNSYLLGVSDTAMLLRVSYDRLIHWDPDWEEIIPNVAESFEANDDGTEYTFTLRRGMKWSDGEPLTADDVMFWYEDVFSNESLNPAPAFYLTSGLDRDPLTVEKVDDYQFKLIFPEPNGLILQWLATYDHAFRLIPRHYLEEFHEAYNPDVDSLVADEGYEDWVQLFQEKADFWANPELPRLHPWLPTNALGDSERIEFERNPYYFKVDPDGSQLPYIDRVVYQVFSDEEVLLLNASNGELDLTFRTVNTPQNKPVLAQNREAGGFRFFDMLLSQLNTMMITFNLCHQDPVKREIFRNRDFRIGLSHAMNRQEVIDSIYQRQGEPWQVAPRPGTPFWDDGGEMGKQYTEYDPDVANDYLDRAGYAERNSDGIRLGPDGEPISFSMLTKIFYPGMVDAMDMICGHWREVGIDARVQAVEDSYFHTATESSEHDGAVDSGDIGYKDILIDPRCFLPAFLQGAFWAMPWYRWYVGEPGDQEEPPEPMLTQMELYRGELRSKTSTDEQYAVMQEILQLAKDEFWMLGLSLPPDGYGTVTDKFHNVPETMWDAFRYPTPGPTNPAQYFISET